MHKVLLTGRLGADPDIRFTADGAPVAKLRLATDERYTNKAGEKIVHTEWHRIVMFGAMATTAQSYLKKGRLIMVEGRLRTRSYDDKDGIKRWVTEIQGMNMEMLDSKPASVTPPDDAPHPAEVANDTDDVPF